MAKDRAHKTYVPHFFLVLQTLTSPNYIMFRIDWPMSRQSYPHFTLSIPQLHSFHWLSVKFRKLFKISLLTYKTLREKPPVYLYSMLAASLPSRSIRSNKGISSSDRRVKTNTGAGVFHSRAPSFWNNLLLSVRSAFQVVTLKKHFKTHIFDLAFPP